MTRTRTPIVPELYICPACGSAQTVHRLASRTRARGHLKTLWCPQCETETNHEKKTGEEMTKAELRVAYEKARAKYAAGGLWTNEYALELDTMLSGYFGLPLLDPAEWTD